MALDPLNGSNLDQLALKGLTVWTTSTLRTRSQSAEQSDWYRDDEYARDGKCVEIRLLLPRFERSVKIGL